MLRFVQNDSKARTLSPIATEQRSAFNPARFRFSTNVRNTVQHNAVDTSLSRR